MKSQIDEQIMQSLIVRLNTSKWIDERIFNGMLGDDGDHHRARRLRRLLETISQLQDPALIEEMRPIREQIESELVYLAQKSKQLFADIRALPIPDVARRWFRYTVHESERHWTKITGQGLVFFVNDANNHYASQETDEHGSTIDFLLHRLNTNNLGTVVQWYKARY